jgi:orotate phosphoribosyltransferase
VKTHGDGGEFVGVPLKSEMRVVLVEDVVTAGTTLNEVVPMLRDRVGVQIAGVVILVDREEKGKGDLSAVQEAEQELGVSVSSIVTIRDVISYLSGSNSSGFMIDDTMRARIEEYRAQYGVACVHG